MSDSKSIRLPNQSDYQIVLEQYDGGSSQQIDTNASLTDYIAVGRVQSIK